MHTPNAYGLFLTPVPLRRLLGDGRQQRGRALVGGFVVNDGACLVFVSWCGALTVRWGLRRGAGDQSTYLHSTTQKKISQTHPPIQSTHKPANARTVGVHGRDGGEGEGDELRLPGPELLQLRRDARLGQGPGFCLGVVGVDVPSCGSVRGPNRHTPTPTRINPNPKTHHGSPSRVAGSPFSPACSARSSHARKPTSAAPSRMCAWFFF